jgi:hypothetical protein
MEPVPFIIASVVGTSLVAAILALWQSHKNDKQAQRAVGALPSFTCPTWRNPRLSPRSG